MGSGCGALNCLANAVRVFVCITSLHFAVEKATKQMISHNMMVLYVFSQEKSSDCLWSVFKLIFFK